VGIKVIVEWKAKPGQRDELLSVIEQMMSDGPPMPGSLGATFYNAVEDPDILVEIADWESADAREAVMKAGEASGAFAPMLQLLAAPPRDTLVESPH
jgi:quinol monooxygenase YgiN